MKDFTIDDIIEDIFDALAIWIRTTPEIPVSAYFHYDQFEIEKLFNYLYNESIKDHINRIMIHDQSREITAMIGLEIMLTTIRTVLAVAKKA